MDLQNHFSLTDVTFFSVHKVSSCKHVHFIPKAGGEEGVKTGKGIQNLEMGNKI